MLAFVPAILRVDVVGNLGDKFGFIAVDLEGRTSREVGGGPRLCDEILWRERLCDRRC
jgi:hypothetical protein